jgi:hypothetical protein
MAGDFTHATPMCPSCGAAYSDHAKDCTISPGARGPASAPRRNGPVCRHGFPLGQPCADCIDDDAHALETDDAGGYTYANLPVEAQPLTYDVFKQALKTMRDMRDRVLAPGWLAPVEWGKR